MAYQNVACLLLLLCGALAFEIPGLGELAKKVLKDPPKRCCNPDEFEISVVQQSGYSKHMGNGKSHSGVTSLVARIAADYNKQQFGTVATVFSEDGKVVTSQTIEDGASKSTYVIQDKQCKKFPFDPSGIIQCMPDPFTFIDQHTIGNNSLTANTWSTFFNETEGMYGYVNIDMEVESCIPVSAFASSRQPTGEGYVESMMSAVYINYTQGVQDRSFWFTPPSFCPTNYSKENFDALTELAPGVGDVHKRVFRWFF